ncbi:MAG TPA: PmoA family protein [Gemmataceae bacterium]|nr:PmoA family protein [Gemmataceae bacterium]
MRLRLCLSLAALAGAACLFPAPAAPAPDGPGVVIKGSKDVLEFRVGKEMVTRYHVGESLAKPYFWPLTASNGAAVTRAWPMEPAGEGDSSDHVHQKSAWFCHGDVSAEGLEAGTAGKGIDFWSEEKGHGRIVCVHVGEPKNANDHASVVTKNEWRTATGTKVLDETRTISLYALGESRLLVLDIDLKASVAAITFGDTKEGSMGVRVNDVIREAPPKGAKGGAGRLTNADGKSGEKAVWGQHSKWCDYSGTLDGKEAGIAIFDDPANKAAAAWHSRGYGLMAANPFGRDKSGFPATKGQTDLVKVPKGERLNLRYGILVHPGDVKEGKVAEAFEKFVKLKG